MPTVLGAGELVAFLNKEAVSLALLQPPLSKSALRGHVRDRLGEAYPFPLRARVRGLVAGERMVEDVRCLEVVPEGLTREAAALAGPVLLPTDRPLQPGSVVTAEVELEDPRLHARAVPGMWARVLALDAQVAVEP